MSRVFPVTGHIRIVNDPIELVSLLVTFQDARYKQIYDLLNRSWMTEAELEKAVGGDCVADCLAVLKKGNLVEEQWRMPEPGAKPAREYRAMYTRFRANFQCNMTDLGELIHIAFSDDEDLARMVDRIEEEIKRGNTSINDLGRKFGVSQVVIRGLARRIPYLDVKGQGLVLLPHDER
jgi:predicted DNA-binding ArsR family transcriptional regulator